MIVQKLHDNWKMRKLRGDSSGGPYISAQVPGSVYNDLIQNKQMEDPFWRDNEDNAFALMENDYEYRTEFTVQPRILTSDRILLRCEGLDTLADITLNGASVGSTDNMHRI
jgi:beta-mannosidase